MSVNLDLKPTRSIRDKLSEGLRKLPIEQLTGKSAKGENVFVKLGLDKIA